jgi:hypothetical protein
MGFFVFLGLQYSRKNRHQSRHLRPTPPRKEPKSGKFRKILIFNDLIYHYSWLRRIYHYPISTPAIFLNKILYQIYKSNIYRNNSLEKKEAKDEREKLTGKFIATQFKNIYKSNRQKSKHNTKNEKWIS